MKVVNIPSTKAMKKIHAHLRALVRLQVPIHANVLKRSVVIASGATQSIARHNRSTDCVASLANDELSLVHHARQNKDARD